MSDTKIFWLWWFLGICHYGTWQGLVATTIAFVLLVTDFLASDLLKGFVKGLRGK